MTLDAWKLVQSWPILAEFVVAMARGMNPDLAADAVRRMVLNDLGKLTERIEAAEDECDPWGNPFLGKQTDAVIGCQLNRER